MTKELKRYDFKAAMHLKACRNQLTYQQYKTLQGQILAGHGDAAMKGLRKILNRRQKGATS